MTPEERHARELGKKCRCPYTPHDCHAEHKCCSTPSDSAWEAEKGIGMTPMPNKTALEAAKEAVRSVWMLPLSDLEAETVRENVEENVASLLLSRERALVAEILERVKEKPVEKGHPFAGSIIQPTMEGYGNYGWNAAREAILTWGREKKLIDEN